MAEPANLFQFPFNGGIDEAARDELVEPGTGWPVLENGRQRQRGGYSHRFGFEAMTATRLDATARTAGHRIFSHKNTIAVVDGSQVDVYDAKSDRWSAANRPPPCGMRLIEQPNRSADATVEDVEYCNGYFAVANLVVDTTSVSVGFTLHVTVTNATTGAQVAVPVYGISSADPIGTCLASYGTYIFLIYTTGGSPSDLFAICLDTTSAATLTTGWQLVSAGPIAVDVVANCIVVAQGLSSSVAIAYINTSGGASQLTVRTIAAGGVLQAQTINTNSVTPIFIDIAGSSADTLWVAWNEALLGRVRGLDPVDITLTAKATTATILTGLKNSIGGVWLEASATTGKGRLYITDLAATTGVDLQWGGFTTTAGACAVDGAAVTVHNVIMCGRPLEYGSRHYAQVFYSGPLHQNTQASIFLVDATADASFSFPTVRPVANPAPNLSVASRWSKGKLTAGAVSSKLYWTLGVTRSAVVDSTVVVECDFASPTRWLTAAHGRATFLTGGVLSTWDGDRVTEAGFLVAPSIPTVSLAGTGITGTFRYVAVWEHADGNGNWAVSGVSSPSASTSPANQTVSVSVYALTITSRLPGYDYTRVRVAFYRTLTGGVAPYYRVGTVLNDTFASTAALTLADTTTDAQLATAAKLYAQPGVIGTAQDRRAPPGLSCIVSYNGMLVGSSGSDLWYSGQDVSGEATWFNPIFQVPIPGEGDVTALFVMDGTLFAAKRREIYALSGEPPADNGSSGGLGLPRRLSADVGAISPFTCGTSLGTFFQSDRGIEILERSQAVTFIGEGIQNTVAAYPIVTSMTVDPSSATVLVELAASTSSGLAAGNGRTGVYDLTLRSWQSTDRRTSSAGVADTPSQSACMVYEDSAWKYAWLGANGIVYLETTSHLDATYWIAKRAVSGHVKVAGLQGSQHVNKVLVLAKKHTSHDVSISFAYDYSATYKTARLYTAAQVDTLTAAIPNMQLEHGLHDDARCEAVRIQLVDATPSTGEAVGTGQAGTWVALAFEAVPQQGAYMLPDEAK